LSISIDFPFALPAIRNSFNDLKRLRECVVGAFAPARRRIARYRPKAG
jgi:hypothetical protein